MGSWRLGLRLPLKVTHLLLQNPSTGSEPMEGKDFWEYRSCCCTAHRWHIGLARMGVLQYVRRGCQG